MKALTGDGRLQGFGEPGIRDGEMELLRLILGGGGSEGWQCPEHDLAMLLIQLCTW